MKVFVTGGTGFVGRYIISELLSKNFEVHAGVRDPEKVGRVFGNQVIPVKVDFSNKTSIRNAIVSVRPDYIVHLIGIIAESPSKGITFEKVHWEIPRDLYEASKDLGIKKTAHMSALGVHPDAPSRYYKSKLKAEQELRSSGVTCTIFRPSVIVGPEQKLFNDMRKLTKILPVVALPDGGKHLMQPVDVRDVACAFVASLQDSASDNKTYELCGPDVVSFRELLVKIFAIWRKKVFFTNVPKQVMSFAGRIAETFMDNPPVTSDLVLMMWKNNVCGIHGDAETGGVKALCRRDPTPLEQSLSWSMSSG